MAWSNMAFEGGMSLIQNGASYLLAKKKAKSDKQWQEWRNKVVNIANAQNQNIITTNENLTLQRDQLQKMAIAKSERLTTAATEVSAAAMGVRGNSVAQTLREVRNNAADANMRRQMDLETQLVGFQAQRNNSDLQAFQQTEFSPIPTPSPASYLLDFGGDMSKLWKQYSPELKSKI